MMTSESSSTGKYRYEHYQNENFVILTIYIKNARKEDVTVEFESEESIHISVAMDSSNSFVLDLEPFLPIVPAESAFTVMGTKIEVRMKKARTGVMWSSLERKQGDPTGIPFAANKVDSTDGPTGTTTTVPSYPSSSKTPKNWDAIEKAVEKEEAKPEGEQALQIYANADENTRKAMNKSFVESGGTVLSTNWSEIGAKKTEIAPPEGMEAKKYEQ